VEKSQYELCLEVLNRFKKAGILESLIVIGSWCIHFYKEYFKSIPYEGLITFKTRDIDFLLAKPSKIRGNTDIPNILKDLGYVVEFKGEKGYVRLDHPELILEFLVDEKGKGSEKPYPLPKLGINATPLRFMSILTLKTIKVKIGDIQIMLPHPACFALHKLIIFQRRTKQEKAIKDKDSAIAILKMIVKKEENQII
jgi:hypothetical protein